MSDHHPVRIADLGGIPAATTGDPAEWIPVRHRLVFLGDPALEREAHAAVVPALVVAVGAAPGTAFTPSAWEARELGSRDADAA
jgi:hypothetical protein